ncbi:MAG: hypothetical protein JW896_18165 [Deltaproteobacteria bacterium]|nr:hypothetical protein [Deltaproteobacteria bacterium]
MKKLLLFLMLFLFVSAFKVGLADAVPDIRGDYSGSYTTVVSNCTDSESNGTYNATLAMSISTQTGNAFSGSAMGTFEVDGLTAVEYIQLSGTITESGQISGNTSHTFLETGGEGTFTGQLTGNTLTIENPGQDTYGETCSYIRSMSASRVSASGAFTTNDMEGIWEVNGLASGPGAPWWIRGPLTVTSNGAFSGSLEEYASDPDSVSGTFSISGDGIITSDDLSTDFRAAMDLGKTVIIGTNTWDYGSPGTTEITTLLKKAESYSMSDMEGTWKANSLASGPGAPWWERGEMNVSADGSFTGSKTESDGTTGSLSGTLNISADGIITIAGSSTLRGSMDSGKTVMIFTNTWSTGSPGTTEIKVMTKKEGSYSQADLAGTWEVNILASGPGAPWWERGEMNISADGSFLGTFEEYQGHPDTLSGTLNISTDGKVTIVGKDNGHCSMDSGKTIITCTATWSWDSVTTEMSVWTKKSGINPSWVEGHGSIYYGTTPLCAMVLANGQYMFTCGDNLGVWDLEVPLDSSGEITLQAYCSGFSPFKTVLTPSEALDFDIVMIRAAEDSREIDITVQTAPGTDNPNWERIWGTVTHDGQDLCAMVLANGQTMFSCGVNPGVFDLEVPLDPNTGEITLQVFAFGFAPYKEVFMQ